MIKTKNSFIALALLVTTVAGPAPARQATAQLAVANNVFFVRAYAEPTAWPATIQVEGQGRASLKQGTFTALKLPLGRHRVKLTWPLLSAQSKSETDITIEPNQTYYFALLGSAGFDHMEGNIIYVRVGSALAAIPPDKAEAVIGTCCTFEAPRPAR